MSEINKYLQSHGKLTALLPRPMTWADSLDFIQKLPYGRNSNRFDPSLVILEMKGTCSSKHAALKMLAEENDIRNVKLILCLYKMSALNTKGVGSILEKYHLEYLPEAHCYLSINGLKQDFTNINSDLAHIENDILEETEIEAQQVGEFKVEYHKAFIKKWLQLNRVEYSFTEVWNIREQCIAALSK